MKPNFYNDNRNRAFPFLKNTVGSRTPTSGAVTMRQLPDDFIVDCGFTIGPESQFEEDEHSIYLYRIRRQGDLIYFEFASDCPSLYEQNLVFIRDIAEETYAAEFVDGPGPIDISISDSEGDECREPLWSGYLISGNMSSIAARLSSGEQIVRSTGDAIVEPALIQNLAGGLLNSLELANDDRTRVSSPDGCPDITWPHAVGLLFLGARCIQGEIRWKPGYNCLITQNSADNSLTIGAAQAAGEGEPCSEVPLFSSEQPPVGSNNSLLSGGSLCNETLRSINGIGGPIFNVIGGAGVSIVPDPEANRVTVDINMVDLAICWNDVSVVSESL